MCLVKLECAAPAPDDAREQAVRHGAGDDCGRLGRRQWQFRRALAAITRTDCDLVAARVTIRASGCSLPVRALLLNDCVPGMIRQLKTEPALLYVTRHEAGRHYHRCSSAVLGGRQGSTEWV